MVVDVEDKVWSRSIMGSHFSMVLTIPSQLAKSIGLAKGTTVYIRKTKNGFEVSVKDEFGKETVEAREEPIREEPVRKTADPPLKTDRWPDMDGVIVE